MCQPNESELLYLKWQALRKCGKGGQGSRLLTRYLKTFPESSRVVEMHYAVAIDCLSAERYDEAMNLLQSLIEHHPKTPEAQRSKLLLEKLRSRKPVS